MKDEIAFFSAFGGKAVGQVLSLANDFRTAVEAGGQRQVNMTLKNDDDCTHILRRSKSWCLYPSFFTFSSLVPLRMIGNFRKGEKEIVPTVSLHLVSFFSQSAGHSCNPLAPNLRAASNNGRGQDSADGMAKILPAKLIRKIPHLKPRDLAATARKVAPIMPEMLPGAQVVAGKFMRRLAGRALARIADNVMPDVSGRNSFEHRLVQGRKPEKCVSALPDRFSRVLVETLRSYS